MISLTKEKRVWKILIDERQLQVFSSDENMRIRQRFGLHDKWVELNGRE